MLAVAAISLLTVSAAAQTGAPAERTVLGGVEAPPARPQRPPMTPEQQAEAAKRREAEMAAPRPIAALDSVWTEELTWMEIRDAIKAGKTQMFLEKICLKFASMNNDKQGKQLV